jgi:hypothetical protein
MNNQVVECKSESKINDSLPKSEIKVESIFYDGMACDFTITVKNVSNGMFHGLAIMFAKYFACLKFHSMKGYPLRAEERTEDLKPLAITVFRELCKQDMQDEEHGAELLELWTNQAFQLLQSGHGV